MLYYLYSTYSVYYLYSAYSAYSVINMELNKKRYGLSLDPNSGPNLIFYKKCVRLILSYQKHLLLDVMYKYIFMGDIILFN